MRDRCRDLGTELESEGQREIEREKEIKRAKTLMMKKWGGNSSRLR